MRFHRLCPILAALAFALAASLGSATPAITTQPTDQVTAVGANASFTLAATVPSGTLSYKWQVSTDNGTTFTDVTNLAPYSNATTATLSITGATFALQGYRYRGVATQTGGTGPGSIKTGENDKWGGSATVANAMAAVGAFAYSGPTSRDATSALSVANGDNSVKVSAVGSGTCLGSEARFKSTPT